MNNIKLIPNKISKAIIVYTDGSSMGNGSKKAIGGIGVFFSNGDPRNTSQETKSALKDLMPQLTIKKITNNISEFTSILKALTLLKYELDNKKEIIIKSDSMYCINSLTNWRMKWERNNWMNSTGKPVLNKEIIQNISDNYLKLYKNQIEFIKVSAHTTRPSSSSILYQDWHGNDQADKLSREFQM